MEEVNVALLGCGNWGANHLRVWSELGHLRLVCDASPARLQHVRLTLPGVETCKDPADVFNRHDIQGVVIATPAPTHAPLARAALEAGKHVLVEKPLALTLRDGTALVESARRNQRILMVGHVLEYHPVVTRLHQLIQAGDLGRVLYLYSNRINFGRIRTEENALWSFAPHDVAIMLRLIGLVPRTVTSTGGAYLDPQVADVTMTNLAFANGVLGHIHVSWLHPFKEHRFVVVGDRQMAVFDDSLSWPDKLRLYPHRVDWLQGRVPVAMRAQAVAVHVEEAEALRVECEHFVSCIVSGSAPLTDGVSALAVLRVLDAAQRSLDAGGSPMATRSDEAPALAYSAHSTATIDPGAEIGTGTRIWHYSHVMRGARIGSDCVIGQNVFVAPNVWVGRGVKIQNNVSLYEGVELDDHVFCGPSMVFTNVMNPRSAIERKSEFRPTRVGRGATLGANCTVVCGHSIGKYAFVGAGAVVTRDVPDHALVLGVPGRVSGWVCECAARLELTGESAICGACQKRYRQTRDGGLERAEA